MRISLQKLRQEHKPILPSILHDLSSLEMTKGPASEPEKDKEEIKKNFPETYGQPTVFAKKGKKRTFHPLKIGVVFSGGQAAGGHNVITGLFDAMKTLHPSSKLFGFLDGPGGIVAAKYRELVKEELDKYRNQGGFDLIGSGRTKIETDEQLAASADICKKLELDGLVIIGGDDSNTNAAILAEYFIQKGIRTKVVGVPKTIDGDLKNDYVAISFGFDTACKVYSEMIGNIARDAMSAKKYYHFIKLMGRSASHIALECAFATHANLTLIGEEVARDKKTLAQITSEIADMIVSRSHKGKNYGVVLIPEGLIEFIPEISLLISELNKIIAEKGSLSSSQVQQYLSPAAKGCFVHLPEKIQQQLILDRDPHGNVQVSLIETERLLMEVVGRELEKRKASGEYKDKFSPLHHFLGYEGRCSYPSNFDAHYCYALGQTALLLLNDGLTGYMAYVKGLTKDAENWEVGGVPTMMFFNIEVRKNKKKAVIEKALVELDGAPFHLFAKKRGSWLLTDDYQFPGPIQFFGDRKMCDTSPITVCLEENPNCV